MLQYDALLGDDSGGQMRLNGEEAHQILVPAEARYRIKLTRDSVGKARQAVS